MRDYVKFFGFVASSLVSAIISTALGLSPVGIWFGVVSAGLLLRAAEISADLDFMDDIEEL